MPITTCDSPETLRAEIETVRKKVSLGETEETWDTIAQGVQHLTCICNNGGCEFPSEMVAGLRSISRPLNSALNSERSRLSGAAVELVTALATGLGSSFDPLVSQLVPTLLALCGRTNKVFTSRARACILAIIQHTRLPSLLSYLAELANHKSVFLRLTATESILACLNCFNPPDLEKEPRARVVEDFIKLTARDASADVRKASREVFKAYRMLMPARVDKFVAPLTPVVKKYLDIQTGPLGINVGQKQTSRPSSRANNNAMEAGQRPASSTASKPPIRPGTDDPAHSTRQRPTAHASSTVVDIRAPQQRVVSQIRRDPPQPRNLHITVQSSSVAQRCVVPASALARPVVQRPPPGAARVLPAPNAPSAGGPQRPPSVQMKFNPPPDRLKVTGTGAKRIPLPPVSVDGHASEQAAAATDSGGRVRSTVDKSRPKLPSKSAEPTAFGRSATAVNRKASEGTRSASSSTKPANRSAPIGLPAAHRSHQQDETRNPSVVAPQRRPPGNVQKNTRPLLKTEKKQTPPTLIPLPPGPSALPTEIPLPPSPDCTLHPADPEVQNQLVVATLPGSTQPVEKQLKSPEPCQQQGDVDSPCTPITTLLSSIQRGFLFTPSTPLSPPQNYLPASGNLPEKRQNTRDVIKGSLAGVPLCIPPEVDSTADSLDRHALRDLN